VNDSPKSRLQKSKEFVRKHKTGLACTVSAATASAITWRISGSVMNHTFQERTQALLLRELILRDFVNSKGLQDELMNEFIPSLK
jgi:hypothetical protein